MESSYNSGKNTLFQKVLKKNAVKTMVFPTIHVDHVPMRILTVDEKNQCQLHHPPSHHHFYI